MSKTRIEVGINDDVYLKSATINDKDSLELTFGLAGVKVLSGFEALQADEIQESTGETSLRLFPVTVPTKDDLTEEKKRGRIIDDITKVRGQLEHILQGYMVAADAKLNKIVYQGTGMDANNFDQQIMQPGVLLAITRNLFREFITLVKPHLNDSTKKFRLKLIRQSKDKHFATLPGKFITEQPFWESMDIPVEATKVKFTAYEIKEGLNDGTPASKSKDADTTPGDTAPLTAENVFGQ